MMYFTQCNTMHTEFNNGEAFVVTSTNIEDSEDGELLFRSLNCKEIRLLLLGDLGIPRMFVV